MMRCVFVFLALPCIFAGFNDGFGPGFGGGEQGFNSIQQNQFGNRFNQAGGESAAAGQAGALGDGAATSINQANHEADMFNTRSSGISANTATGFSPFASGAANAGGQVGSGAQFGSQFGQNSGFARFKRQIGYGGYPGFGSFGQQQQQSNGQGSAVGGGQAYQGDLNTFNQAGSYSNPNSASAYGSGGTQGQGLGVNIFQASSANSNSGSNYGY